MTFRMTARSGFTILEAIIALVIVSLVAIGSLAAVGAQLRVTEHAQRTTEATALAEERLAAVRVLTQADLQSLPDPIAAGRFAAPLNAYTWHVSAQPSADLTGLYTVVVQIDWADGNYTLTSRVYRPPPILSDPGLGQNAENALPGGNGTNGGGGFNINIGIGGGGGISIGGGT